MKQGSTLFLKIITVLIAIGALVGLVGFPRAEGRAAGLDTIGIYSDPFVVYIYIASIPFFVALFQAIRVLGFVETNSVFSQPAIRAVRTIKCCAVITTCFLVVAMGWVRFASGGDDPAGAIVVGMCVTLAVIAIANATAVFQKLLQNAVDIKSAHEFTLAGRNL